MSNKKIGLQTIYTPVLVLLLIVAAFYVGRLSSQVEGLKNNVIGTDTTAPDPAGNQAVPVVGERKLDVASLKARAKNLGLNTGKFDQCLDSGTTAAKVSAEQKEGGGARSKRNTVIPD